MTMFMETTRISAERTVHEIQSILGKHGAQAVLLEYEACAVAAVSFKFQVEGKDVPFRLPCRWHELETILRQNGKRPKSDDTFEAWARRVAWRQILRWVEAQFALIETNMVKVQEVFLPYIQTKDGKTLYEKIEGQKFQMLEMRGKP